MHNSLESGQQTAKRILIAQSAAGLLAAGLMLLLSVQHAVAALFGAAIVCVGTWLLAWRLLKRLMTGAMATMRMLTAVVLKWLLVGWLLYVAIILFKLPFVGVLVGLIAAIAAQFFLWTGKRF